MVKQDLHYFVLIILVFYFLFYNENVSSIFFSNEKLRHTMEFIILEIFTKK